MTRTIVEIDAELCDGCGDCVPSCHEGALAVIDGKAVLRSESLCDGIGDCIGVCPRGAIRVRTRPDECPSSRVLFRKTAAAPAERAGLPPPGEPGPVGGPVTSALGHWPVKIRLAPPQAPFLDGADLVIAADCVPVAMTDFHARFVSGRAVLIGCPKFDSAAEYAERFRRILSVAQVQRITVLVMEVPCCRSLVSALLQACDEVGWQREVEGLVVGVDGRIRTRAVLRPGPEIPS